MTAKVDLGDIVASRLKDADLAGVRSAFKEHVISQFGAERLIKSHDNLELSVEDVHIMRSFEWTEAGVIEDMIRQFTHYSSQRAASNASLYRCSFTLNGYEDKGVARCTMLAFITWIPATQ